MKQIGTLHCFIAIESSLFNDILQASSEYKVIGGSSGGDDDVWFLQRIIFQHEREELLLKNLSKLWISSLDRILVVDDELVASQASHVE